MTIAPSTYRHAGARVPLLELSFLRHFVDSKVIFGELTLGGEAGQDLAHDQVNPLRHFLHTKGGSTRG